MTEMTGTEDVWSARSYSEVAMNYLRMAGRLVDQTAVSDGDRVLDIATGTGNVAITAASHGARVWGVDITRDMLEIANDHAVIADLDDLEWQVGAATALPYQAGTFDVTLSALGHMYGDPPEESARELLRVTKAGGRIGFTSWNPTTVYPSMAGILMIYLSPEDVPDFSEPPFMWGDTDTVRSRLEDNVTDLQFATETLHYPALSPEHFFEHTATHSGMFSSLYETVAKDERDALREQLVECIDDYYDDTQNAVEIEYLLTTATVS